MEANICWINSIALFFKNRVFKAQTLKVCLSGRETYGFEWMLGTELHDQFIFIPFVVAIGHGLYGVDSFGNGGWWPG